MMETVPILLVVVTICSYLSVRAWINARRVEREAFYRADTIKKIVELQGSVPESLIETLREALEQSNTPSIWLSYDYNREREAYYRNQTLRRLVATPGGAPAVAEIIRQEDYRMARRRAGLVKLTAMILGATGLGFMIFLRMLDSSSAVYLVGLIPILIGIGLLTYAFGVMPSEANEARPRD